MLLGLKPWPKREALYQPEKTPATSNLGSSTNPKNKKPGIILRVLSLLL
jgi:hypothetical protein